MKYSNKTKKQLIDELREIHQRLVESEASETRCNHLEQELRYSEECLKVLFEYSPDGIYVSDLKGNLVDGNETAEQLIGYPMDELRGKNFLKMNVLPEKQIPKASALLGKNISGQSAGPVEFTFNRKDGTQTTVEVRTYPIAGKDKTLVLGIARNITKHKYIEEVYQSILDYSMQGFALTQDFRFIFVNKALAEFSGYTIRELLDFTPEDIRSMVHPDDREYVFGVAQKRLKGENVPPYSQFRFIRKDGSVRWAEQYSRLIEYQGRPATIVHYIDVTDHKQAVEALKKEKSKVEKYLDIAGVMFLVIDRNHKVRLINRKGCKILGYKAEDIIGKKWFDNFLPGRYRENVKGVFNKLIRGEIDAVEYFENPVLTCSGEERIIAWHNALLKDDQNNIIGTLSSGEDITERREAEQSLADEATHRRILVEQSRDGIVILDQDGKVYESNQKFADMLGYPLEAMQQLHVFDWEYLYPPERTLEMICTVDEKGDHFETKHRRKDGSIYDVEISTNAAMFSGQKLIFCICRDITERKKMENSLRESERKYRELADHLPQLVCETDTEGNIIYANQNAFDMFGYSLEDLEAGLPIWQMIDSKDLARAKKNKLKAFAGKFVGGNEYNMRRKDGSSFPMLIYSRPLVRNGKPMGLRVIGVDITQQKKTAEQLARSERRFRTLFENAVDGMILLNNKGTFIDCNAKIEKMFGLSKGKILEKKPWDFSPLKQADGRDSKEKAKELTKAAFLGESQLFEWEHIRPDGSLVDAEINLSKIEAEGEEVILAIIRDITEQRQAEKERIRSTQKLLSAMEATIEAMALTVDIRDPYTAGHQRRVAELAVAIAMEMGLAEEVMQGIKMAGIVHDIGKIQVPAEILSKPGRLTELEFGLIKNHPSAGYEILKNVEFPWPVAQIVFQHHERMDGSGYPNGISGKDILLESRIMGVADVVEAMVSHRPYRPALSIETALEEITQKKGILYDADVVDACYTLFKEKKFVFK